MRPSARGLNSLATHSLRLDPVRALSGTVALPGSKSVSNRALLLAALARGQTSIDNLLRSRQRSATAIDAAAQVINHNTRTALRQLQGMRTSKAGACARDDGHLAVEG